MKRKLIVLGLALSTLTTSFSQQDEHFSMFTESPVYLNPAAAGFAPGSMQLFTNFRMQWSTVSDNPYRTISASADWKMFDQGAGFLGAGINFFNDVAGASNYQTNVIAIPIDYAFMLSEDNYFSVGLQPGFYQRSIKNENTTWGSQWNGLEYDQGINSGELILNQNLNTSRFDIAAGVYWSARFSKKARLRLGLSGQHLTKERINFMTDDERLYRKLNIHGQGEFKREGTNLTILPAFYTFLQGPNKEIIAGSNFRFLMKGASRSTSYFDEVSLSLGGYFRVGDAVIVNAMFDMAGLSIGASYDFNISSLNVATRGVGAMEFYLRYRIQFGTRDLRHNRVKSKD